ncbi:MAG: hypothetical protein ACLRRN_00460 [Oscillospiraceae bacterium]
MSETNLSAAPEQSAPAAAPEAAAPHEATENRDRRRAAPGPSNAGMRSGTPRGRRSRRALVARGGRADGAVPGL